jgi:ATP-dependent RNA helicase DHR2
MPKRELKGPVFDGNSIKATRHEKLLPSQPLVDAPPPAIIGKKRKRNGPAAIKGSPRELIQIKKLSDEDSINGSRLRASPNDTIQSNHEERGTIKKPIPSRERSKQNEVLKPLDAKRAALLEARKQLPIWSQAEKIRQGLRGEKDVLLLVGETGSGKSTQVPQFLLDETWCQKCIAITQPRRVAAISLARRVADEMGTPLGSSSPASKVGYSVRFDVSTSPSTRIKFLTEGMLLQEMLRDPWLRQYSSVIVDEVHERSVNVDLILGFLRNLVSGDQKGRKGQRMKVVVMSATADIDSLYKFFDSASVAEPTRVESAKSINDDSSGESWAGVSSADEQSVKKKGQLPLFNGTKLDDSSDAIDNKGQAMENLAKSSGRITICYVKGRQYEVKLQYLSQPTLDFQESALQAIFELHMHEPLPGDILVFMTGQDTVEGLERLVNEYAATMDAKYPKVSPNVLDQVFDMLSDNA